MSENVNENVNENQNVNQNENENVNADGGNDVKSVSLASATESVSGHIGVGDLIVNDYVITLDETDNGYTISVQKGSQTQSVDVNSPNEIESVFSVQTSDIDGGENIVRVLLSDGTFTDFSFYNGHQGSQGEAGLSPSERQSIIDGEYERIDAENSRAIAEAERENDEASRILNEQIRVNAEAERDTQEKNRISAENTRISAESARNAAESERNREESVRSQHEEQRVLAENDRVQEWIEKKGECNAAIDAINTLSGKVDNAADVAIDNLVTLNNAIYKYQQDMENVSKEVEDIVMAKLDEVQFRINDNGELQYHLG